MKGKMKSLKLHNTIFIILILLIPITYLQAQHVNKIFNESVVIDTIIGIGNLNDSVKIKGIRDSKIVNIGIVELEEFQDGEAFATITHEFEPFHIEKHDFILKDPPDMLDRNAFGIEFWGSSFKRIFIKENIPFNGRICHDSTCTSYDPETQIKDANINVKYPSYDIGIFYRFKRLKIGWIATAFYKKSLLSEDYLYYNFITEDNKRSELAGYSLNIKAYNIAYLECYGLRVFDSNNSNIYANLVLRIDHYKLGGEFVTYKFPFGFEWGKPNIIIERKKIDETFTLLSIGPKMAFDFKLNRLLDNNPLMYFRGVDLAITFDVPIGLKDFIVKDFRILGILVLEF